jgi:hypothetical protein
MDKYFPLPLIVRHIDGRMWELMKPFEYHPKKWDAIKVPPKFIFDFASIPKILWSVIGSPTGRYGPAALVHDYLLYTMEYPRRISDRIFLEAMKDLKVPYLKRIMMYFAVRIWSYF